jgi:hypothetical protein
MDAGYELLTALDEDSMNVLLCLFNIFCIVVCQTIKDDGNWILPDFV